jgi:hypothetical protein
MNTTTELVDQVFHRARQNVVEIFDEYHAEEKRRLAVYKTLKDERLAIESTPTPSTI